MADVKLFADCTIAEKFIGIKDGVYALADAEVQAFLEDRAEKSKKAKGSSKPTEKQRKMREEVMPKVLDALTDLDKPALVGEIVTALNNELNSQIVTRALMNLIEDKVVVNTKEKGKSFYSVVE